jgi:MATE family, multidrug efflux pump
MLGIILKNLGKIVQKNNILADNNIKKLLFKLSLPATIGMIVMALYNVVDTIFVGRGVGSLGIAALAIVFPIQMIVMAIGQLLGMGGASVVSRSLGEGNIRKANSVIGTIFTTTVIFSVIITIVFLIFKEQLLVLFGASEGIYPYAKDYYEIIVFASILFITAMSTNSLVRAEGHAKVAMNSMMIGAVLNIILDPIFIFSLDMGVRGAAIATVISQFIAVIYIIRFINSGKSILKVKFIHLRVKLPILREIFVIGISSFMRNVAGSLVFALFNRALGANGGDLAIAAYGIVQRFLRFLVMPTIGIAQGLQPIAGYNYGAGRFDKVREVSRIAIIWATGVASFGFLVAQLFPNQMMMIFTDDPELIAIGANAMHLMMLMTPLVGFQIVGTTIFQALGKALPSLILSMSREIIFLIPLILILPKFWGLNGIWLTLPISDVLSFALTGIMFYGLLNHLKKPRELSLQAEETEFR